MRLLTITGLLVLGLLASSTAVAEDMTGKARVVDAANLQVGDSWVRLYGIDAPRVEQTCTASGVIWHCGRQALMALSNLVYGRLVTCEVRNWDRFARGVAVCRAGDVELNREMVRQGWALADRQSSPDYVQAEEDARRREAGLWMGDFAAPRDRREN